MKIGIRAKLTLTFAVLMLVVLGAAGVFLYAGLASDLTRAIDEGLRSRAQTMSAELDDVEHNLSVTLRGLDPDESFAQIISNQGASLESSASLAGQRPLLESTVARTLSSDLHFQRSMRVKNEDVLVRFLAVPVSGRVIVVGQSIEDRADALRRLARLLWLGGGFALAVTTAIGWYLAGAALAPVEKMRAQAAAITMSGPGNRLAVPDTGDEIARLGSTLNAMLARIEDVLDRERRFVDDASHELRGPLANLKTELELALRRARSPEELEAALRSTAEESDRLNRLAEDLLVLARSDRGQLNIRREPASVAELVDETTSGFATRAAKSRISIEADVPAALTVSLDRMRIRQALVNLIDNALLHTPEGGTVGVTATANGTRYSLAVTDSGGGFPDDFLPHVFERFTRADAARGHRDGGAGLGLAIVQAVAEAHGGTATAGNASGGGAIVRLDLPIGHAEA